MKKIGDSNTIDSSYKIGLRTLILTVIILFCITSAVVTFFSLKIFNYRLIPVSITISATIVLMGFIGYYLLGYLINPIINTTKRLLLFSEGQLNGDTLQSTNLTEVGVMVRSLNSVLQLNKLYIDEIKDVLNQLEQKNLCTDIRCSFIGDYKSIELSLLEIIQFLNVTMQTIGNSSHVLSSSAGQVSSGAQALAQGATEQASSIEELSATITEISQQIKQNAENTQLANTEAITAGDEVKTSSAQMLEMRSAMNNINTKSIEISKIIKTIEDIAFQTNILALNAAVEAARAGAAGKGFAVVADEVRNLAQKSAEAVKNTTTLIEETVQAVDQGTKIADSAAKSMQNVVECTNKVSALINQIAQASNEQAMAVSQVITGIDQISAVVQTNSATAEESAAASEELNGQAQLLKDQISQFKLKNSENTSKDNLINMHEMSTSSFNCNNYGESKY